MSIDANEWNKKSRFEEDKEKVYEFLKKNSPKAFDASEISENVKLPKIDGNIKNMVAIGFDWNYLSGILIQLREEGKIERKYIDGTTYYRVPPSLS